MQIETEMPIEGHNRAWTFVFKFCCLYTPTYTYAHPSFSLFSLSLSLSLSVCLSLVLPLLLLLHLTRGGRRPKRSSLTSLFVANRATTPIKITISSVVILPLSALLSSLSSFLNPFISAENLSESGGI